MLVAVLFRKRSIVKKLCAGAVCFLVVLVAFACFVLVFGAFSGKGGGGYSEKKAGRPGYSPQQEKNFFEEERVLVWAWGCGESV